MALRIALRQPPSGPSWQTRPDDTRALQGPPLFPDRLRCKMEKPPTQKTLRPWVEVCSFVTMHKQMFKEFDTFLHRYICTQ